MYPDHFNLVWSDGLFTRVRIHIGLFMIYFFTYSELPAAIMKYGFVVNCSGKAARNVGFLLY